MKKFLLGALAVLCLSQPLSAQTEKNFTADDLIKSYKRISAPVFSPDGKQIAFVVTASNYDENKTVSNIWTVSADGKSQRQFTVSDTASSINPLWSPDGSRLAFVSDRKNGRQIWLIDTGGGEARALTDISSGVSRVLWSPDGRNFLFSSNVYKDAKDDAQQKKMKEAEDKSKVKAKIYDSLVYRHVNRYRNDKRDHLFVASASDGGFKNLTPGSNADVPPIALWGSAGYAFSPDGKEICYCSNTDEMLATSTNNDLFLIPAGGGTAKRITSNKANDNQPFYSPDGRYIAYRAQMKAGYEADRYRLMLYDRASGRNSNLSEDFDYSVKEMFWSPDSKSIYFSSDDRAKTSLFRYRMNDGKIDRISRSAYDYNFDISPDGKQIVFVRELSEKPAELYVMGADGKNARQISFVNQKLTDSKTMNSAEHFIFKGAGGTDVEGFIVKPVNFDPAKKYPALLLIHGGPQSLWTDSFGITWNPQVYASAGYTVIKINPRGSTGYGQKFTDEINRDWGGKPYEDLMLGTDYVVKNYPFVDEKRIAAYGGSYGGYMVNWMAGNTDRYACLISFVGGYNMFSKYGATDELWFPEWDFGGTPWTAREEYEKHSPHTVARNMKTPTLVIHGALDYRVPVGEGMQMFTTLQRLGTPSQFLLYPDEGHGVVKPQNQILLFDTVLKWLDTWCKPEANR